MQECPHVHKHGDREWGEGVKRKKIVIDIKVIKEMNCSVQNRKFHNKTEQNQNEREKQTETKTSRGLL